MRIACLQFAPQVGDIDNNLNRADAVLSRANPQDLDLLVLPELAFTGYNFKSLQHISPYLEPTASGITSLWARTTALKYDCVVTVGYPEKVDVTPKWPASPEYYNSTITVNADGETIANYRKCFLYSIDETWALEGTTGFFDGHIDGLGDVAMGICMDLNPYKFEAPWSAWEFSYHILHKEANLVILSMAWLTREDARAYSRSPKEPDMETLSYWLARLEPLIRAETKGEIIVVIANRCGTEEEAVYSGTSAVLGIHDGEVLVYGILGRGEKELLVVDTNKRPQAKLISETPTMITSPKQLRETRASEPRTSSSSSENSIKSNLTLDTQSTGISVSGLRTPDAMYVALDDDDLMITPLSPIDASTSSHFFKPTIPPKLPLPIRDNMLPGVHRHEQFAGHPIADSPTIFRPPSRKAENASGERQREDFRGPPLASPGFIQELLRLRLSDQWEDPSLDHPEDTQETQLNGDRGLETSLDSSGHTPRRSRQKQSTQIDTSSHSNNSPPPQQSHGTSKRSVVESPVLATSHSLRKHSPRTPSPVSSDKTPKKHAQPDVTMGTAAPVVVGQLHISGAWSKENDPTLPDTDAETTYIRKPLYATASTSFSIPPASTKPDEIYSNIPRYNSITQSRLLQELPQLPGTFSPPHNASPRSLSRLTTMSPPLDSPLSMPIPLENRGLPNHLDDPQSALIPRPRSALW